MENWFPVYTLKFLTPFYLSCACFGAEVGFKGLSRVLWCDTFLSVNDYLEENFLPIPAVFFHAGDINECHVPGLHLSHLPSPPPPDKMMYLIGDFGRRNWTYLRWEHISCLFLLGYELLPAGHLFFCLFSMF